jgi:hypothetical protein
MFIEKFVEFFDNLIKCSIDTKDNISKTTNDKENGDEIINDYNLEVKSKKYVDKHINSLLNSSLKKFLENKSNEKFSSYLKLLQNIYCDISEFSNIFPNFKSLKMTLKLYFVTMRTIYYNNKKLEKILISNDNFTIFIDFFFKDIFLYAIRIFPNIDINNKNDIHNLNVSEKINESFIGKTLPFIQDNNSEIQIPLDILYNITDYRYDIMKDLINKGKTIKQYFENQEKYINDMKSNIYLGIIIYFLNEIKEKYFVDRFIKYLELSEEDKKILIKRKTVILDKLITK